MKTKINSLKSTDRKLLTILVTINSVAVALFSIIRTIVSRQLLYYVIFADHKYYVRFFKGENYV